MLHGARIEKLVYARRNVEPTRKTGLISRQRQRSHPFCNEVAGIRAMFPLDRQRLSPTFKIGPHSSDCAGAAARVLFQGPLVRVISIRS